ncbi:serine hydrolase domain-containing protein [Streptoalloteichus hindustanus]|uniref:CubicO group peptidase, beta-lactamase class C family n=1 Tax=Streptoalloteichus hindustanus TaxID=2017 RepID=A0A1M5FCB3_STRHI|nr:serine hydrolase [Streptoalloteichus hindustanus]SHF89126.1 CubicO group peptidase, beta-lactamase class C family [Streptoalloteichus hindustanus]
MQGLTRRTRGWAVITGLVLLVSACSPTSPPDVAISPGSSAQQGANAAPVTCRTSLDDELRRLKVPGLSVGIVKHGRLVCTGVAGQADVRENRPVTPDTLFIQASVTKTVTATALMRLHDQGKFRLDDDINNYLPFPVRNPNCRQKPITFRQLLTHTSSIKDFPDMGLLPTEQLLPQDSDIPLTDYLKSWLTPEGRNYDAGEVFHKDCPGEDYDYSNMGFVLAGELAQRIGGKGLDDLAREEIFTPLGMKETSYFRRSLDQNRMAMPFDRTSSGFQALGHYGEPNWPDGMLRTSVPQLARFLLMFMGDGEYDGRRILSASTVAEMRKVQFPKLSKEQGLAWYYRNFEGRRHVLGHVGEDHGASSYMFFDPNDGSGVILLANGNWYKREESPAADKLASALFREAATY